MSGVELLVFVTHFSPSTLYRDLCNIPSPASILDSDSDDDNTITINLNSDSDDEISDQPSGVETRDADGNLTTEYRAMLNTLQRRQERRERQLVNILQHRR